MPLTPQTKSQIRRALLEDEGTGDVTSRLLIPRKARGSAVVIAREAGIFCGEEAVRELVRAAGRGLTVRFFRRDGKSFSRNQKVLELRGPVRKILLAERTLLNFLGRLSGIATLTRRFADKVRRCRVSILDTRKTTPLWRELEKLAVKTGGGKNHRRGLYDAVFVKENHRPYGDLKNLRRAAGKFEIEVRNFRELAEALMLRPGAVVFDNFRPRELAKAVKTARRAHPRIRLEASGGVKLSNVVSFARTGVDQISIGALTHSAKALDFSLLVK